MKKAIIVIVALVIVAVIAFNVYYANNLKVYSTEGQTVFLNIDEEATNKEVFKEGFTGVQNKKGEQLAGEDEVTYDVVSGSIDTSSAGTGTIEGTIVYKNQRIPEVITYEVKG